MTIQDFEALIDCFGFEMRKILFGFGITESSKPKRRPSITPTTWIIAVENRLLVADQESTVQTDGEPHGADNKGCGTHRPPH